MNTYPLNNEISFIRAPPKVLQSAIGGLYWVADIHLRRISVHPYSGQQSLSTLYLKKRGKS